MRRQQLGQGWQRVARVTVLVAAGALGLASKWVEIPRWAIFLAAATVPAMWAVTRYQNVQPGETEAEQQRRKRNIAIGLALFAMVALFYAATMVRLGANALNRPI